MTGRFIFPVFALSSMLISCASNETSEETSSIEVKHFGALKDMKGAIRIYDGQS